MLTETKLDGSFSSVEPNTEEYFGLLYAGSKAKWL